MKLKINLFILFLSILTISYAQEDKQAIQFFMHGNMGFTELKIEKHLTMSASVQQATFGVSIPVKNFSLLTAIQLEEIKGNGHTAKNPYFYKSSSLGLPVDFCYNINFENNFQARMGLGGFVKKDFSDSFEYLSKTNEDVYNSLKYGARIRLDLIFNVTESFDIGLNMQLERDFSTHKANTSFSKYYGERQQASSNSFGLIFLYNL